MGSNALRVLEGILTPWRNRYARMTGRREKEKERQQITDWLGMDVTPSERQSIQERLKIKDPERRIISGYGVIIVCFLILFVLCAAGLLLPPKIAVIIAARCKYDILLVVYVIMGLVSFMVMEKDKLAAQAEERRSFRKVPPHAGDVRRYCRIFSGSTNTPPQDEKFFLPIHLLAYLSPSLGIMGVVASFRRRCLGYQNGQGLGWRLV